jgi:uncharacterized RDD family membrane protein YckC
MQLSTPAAASGEPFATSASRIAPMSDRAIAAFFDVVVMSSVFPVIGMWAALRWGGITSSGFDVEGMPGLFVVATVGAIGFLYLWLGEGLFGATLGKAIMRLRVRNLAGGMPGLRRSLLRNLARAVDGIGVYLVGLVFALTSPQRQRLGDRVAGTVVVAVDARRGGRIGAAIVCAAIVAASLVTAVALHSGAPASAFGPQLTRAELGTDHTADYDIIGPSNTFLVTQPTIVCVWQTQGVPTSEAPIRSVWIAEDVGNAAPPNTKIAEKSLAGADVGDFTLSAPSGGWPAGKYRLEIYIGDALVKSLPYTVTQN